VADGGLPAVFVEPQFRSEVIERAAQDAGVAVGTIYSDVLDEDVSTYIEMMRANARTLAEYLK
jgi:ABC-type Zn uptake system ZnuABC Zn-binding protein ZnuA